MKYNIAKGWIAEIITKSYITGGGQFKDEDYSEAINMVINDFHKKLK